MNDSLENLTVLRGILRDEVFFLFTKSDVGFAQFVSAFYNRKNLPEAGLDFYRYAEELVTRDENAVSRSLAGKKEPPEILKRAFKRDLEIIFKAVGSVDPEGYFTLCPSKAFKDGNADEIYNFLKKKYKTCGYGRFMDSYALKFDGVLAPVRGKNDVDLNELKNYKEQKRLIFGNFENFTSGLPFSDMLLYGEKGTGKSSTVRAVAKEFAKKGLRLIELSAQNAVKIADLKRILADEPLKFAIFLDDLSLDASDGRFTELKADIEGSAETCDNVMIVATSNRRHMVKENFSDRDNAVHASDTIEEQLSLSDRFGLTVLFSGTDKEEYLSIVSQLAKDAGLKMPEEQLFALAERFAIYKGGRSPRRARQFVDIACAAQCKGTPIDF